MSHQSPQARGALLALALTWLATACSQQPIVLPSHDFDRPTDMAFSCLEMVPGASADAPTVLGGQPMDVCHPPGVKDPAIGGTDPASGNTYKTYAYVANSGRGDVSIVDMSFCRKDDSNCRQHAFQPGAALVDLDPNTIGYASVPVGELPEVIDASQDGCRVVTANRGSCDLTVIDPAALMTPSLAGRMAATNPTRTFMVRTAAGTPLAVAPGEIAFVPQQTNIAGIGRGPASLCAPDGTLAAPVGAAAATADSRAAWHAVVTFPSCDLVALVDLRSETILDSYRVRPGRDDKGNATDVVLFHTGANPVCPRVDCGLGAGINADAGTPVTQPAATADASDGGTSDGGDTDGGNGGAMTGDGGGSSTAPLVTLDEGPAPLEVRPIAIRPEGTSVYFGATNWSAVGALGIAGDAFSVPATGAITPLYQTSGVMRMRLSVDPYAYVNGHLAKPTDGSTDPNDPTKPELGRFVARTDVANLQYLYAIARDSSVRILDVSRPDPTECDLGIDPTAVSDSDPHRKCFPFGASDNPPRLPQAPFLPGLRFPSAPQDVAFANYWTEPSATSTDESINEQIVNGAYAFVLTSGGNLFVINVDPEPRMTQRVYYTDAANPSGPPIDVQPPPVDRANPDPTAPAMAVLAAGLQPERPSPLPNTPRDSNVITYVAGLLGTSGPARVSTTNPITTSNGPLLQQFNATTTRENAIVVPLVTNGTLTPPPLSSAVQTYVFFPNLATVVPQAWTIMWEPNLTGTRNAGDIDRTRVPGPDGDPNGLAFALTDFGGAFCSNGMFPGDTVTLEGCSQDSNCGPGRVCVHSTDAPASGGPGYAINGLCMKASTTSDPMIKARCAPLLRSFRRYEIQPTTTAFDKSFKDRTTPESTVVLLPKKSELPVIEPCTKSADCQLPRRPDLSGYSCQRGRCLILCDGSDGKAVGDEGCLQTRPGSVCVNFQATDGHSFCADGAPLKDAAGNLEDACGLDQLVPYSVWAGGAFVVAGSSSGRTDPGISSELRVLAPGGVTSGTGGAGGGAGGAGGMGGGSSGPATTGTGFYQCASDRSVPAVVARIPLRLPHCDSPTITAFTAVPGEVPGQTYLGPTDVGAKAIFTDSRVPSPNPCLVEYGPTTVPCDSPMAGSLTCTRDTGGADAGAGDAGGNGGTTTLAGLAGPTYSAVFQNREIRFVLTNLETTIGDTVQIKFGVEGGSVGQQVTVSTDSAIGLPSRVVVGPVPAADQAVDVVAPSVAGYVPSDLPFLFVIDQRTSAAGRLANRGQLLRVAPRIADTSPTPAYQSSLTSNSYFPIQ